MEDLGKLNEVMIHKDVVRYEVADEMGRGR